MADYIDITELIERDVPVLLSFPSVEATVGETAEFSYKDYASNADKYYLDGEVDDGVLAVDTSEAGSFEYDIKIENAESGLTAEGTLNVDVVES